MTTSLFSWLNCALNPILLYDWETACENCPDGWHLPSDDEWTELTDYLGGENLAGGRMKETGTTHWNSPNIANNASGFTALPGGYRCDGGGFDLMGKNALFWSSTENDKYTHLAWERHLGSVYGDIYRGYDYKNCGFSIRCVKDK